MKSDPTQRLNNGHILSAEKDVSLQDGAVRRPVYAWTESVHVLLRHLHARGLPVPRVLDGRDGDLLEYIEGEQVHPHRWSEEGLVAVAQLVARLHAAAREFSPPENAVWQPWYLRELGEPSLCCHGDIAPWNVITRDGLPIGLIDWEFAGPLDPLYELARVCWLFVQLYDDDLREKYDLPSAGERAGQVRMMLDAYGLSRKQREGFFERILSAAICETAHEAIDPGIMPEDEGPLWGFAWRTRSLYWMWRNRAVFERVLG